ncbi:MAG: glycerophosphodiester phosphodiesterase [Verrucomicrobiota bacterium]|nr:glycerophosphodiester phosphodiesterase [Verrucomicrobiota bacterium]
MISRLGGSLFGVEIIGHRGASFDAPENSLTSMKLAWKQNADAIETDIHLSKDDKIVVMHDFDTKRISGVDKNIIDQTWEELQKLDVGKWKGEPFAGEKIPTLDSFFTTIPDGKSIFTEIKIPETKILSELDKAMTASGKKPEQLRIITFHYEMAKAAKEKFPAHPVYWLADWKKDKQTGEYPKLDDLIQKAKAANLDGLDLNFHFPIDKTFVTKIHQAGLKLYSWTVDDPETARHEIEAGVDGITTNRPQFLREQLSNK